MRRLAGDVGELCRDLGSGGISGEKEPRGIDVQAPSIGLEVAQRIVDLPERGWLGFAGPIE